MYMSISKYTPSFVRLVWLECLVFIECHLIELYIEFSNYKLGAAGASICIYNNLSGVEHPVRIYMRIVVCGIGSTVATEQ